MNIEPCMWCESTGSMHTNNNAYTSLSPRYWVHCVNCQAFGPERKSKDEAIEAWNEVARIVREARDPQFVTPSFAIQEMFIYRGMRYEVIWKKTESEDAYFVKINDYLYDNEHETFTDAYAWMLNEVDILIAAKEKDNA